MIFAATAGDVFLPGIIALFLGGACGYATIVAFASRDTLQKVALYWDIKKPQNVRLVAAIIVIVLVVAYAACATSVIADYRRGMTELTFLATLVTFPIGLLIGLVIISSVDWDKLREQNKPQKPDEPDESK